MTDDISLNYLFGQQNLNVRQARWLSFLSEYDFEIKHIKGKENKVYDALSTHTNPLYVTTRSNYKTYLEEKIRTTIVFDQNYQKVRERTTENEANNRKKEFSLNQKRLLTYKNKLYVPNSEEIKLIIMDELHKRPYSNHPRYQKMVTMMSKDFFWSKMKYEAS